MEDNRIQNQIAIYMTNKKLCEFTDKLKPAPIEYYAHMHAQGEEQADGIRAYSCIGVVLQDYSNGTGDKTVRVTANLSPGFFPFVLSRMQNNLDRFDFTEDMIFGEPDEHGLSTVTKLSVKRATVEPMESPGIILGASSWKMDALSKRKPQQAVPTSSRVPTKSSALCMSTLTIWTSSILSTARHDSLSRGS